MLEEALLLAHQKQQLQEKQASFLDDLKQLPLPELQHIVRTGEIKLACAEPNGEGRWLESFKGTPFFEQAIALEQESIQAAMAEQQSRTVESQKSQQMYSQMDQIRLKKRLLELQKARNEAQVLSGGGGPPTQTGSGAEAQGAGALGPVAAEGQQDGMGDAHKLGEALRKVAMSGGLMSSLASTAGAGPKLQGQITNVGQRLIGAPAGQVKSMARKGTLLQNAPATAPTRALAVDRDPFAKVAAYEGLKRVGKGALGGGLAMGALGALTPPDKDNPSRATNALGGALGGALIGGSMGGAHHSIVSHRGGKRGLLSEEAKQLGQHLKNKGKAALTHTKDSVKGHLKKNHPETNAATDKMLGMMKKKSSAEEAILAADAQGRVLARADMAKVARAQEVLAAGDALGRTMAKSAGSFVSRQSVGHALFNPLPGSGFGAGLAGAMTEPGQPDAALRGAGIGAMMGSVSTLSAVLRAMQTGIPGKYALLIPLAGAVGGALGGAHAAHRAALEKPKKKEAGALASVGKWALEHPQQAGAVAGGTLGAAHGLFKPDGGMGSALAEGAAGAAVVAVAVAAVFRDRLVVALAVHRVA